ncbi:alpha/beta fold hydrolase [uncultured Ferrimonas sp.]|uniref:alpha/beta hydrolase family protein n=1 Tax=uncultured Ferrimonas sp. TaxID=432640 RepID=UPI0026178CEF|nr:alpha/beta fold hydrolase [uncultured Ferrimonas sp.]
MQPQQIQCADGQPLSVHCYPSTQQPSRGAVLLAPALGVPQRFYRAFATHLASQGYQVISVDYRGIGDSPLQVAADVDVRMSDWGTQDLPAALGYLKSQAQGQRCHVIGHSCGGQLLGLSQALDGIASITCIGSSVPYWRYYGRKQWKMWLFWHLLLPLLSQGQRFPAQQVGLSKQSLPVGIIRQWARWGRSKDYLFDPRNGFDLSGYHAYQGPLLNIGFVDDDYAPPAAVADLAQRYSQARHSERIWQWDEVKAVGGIGHFNYFRPSHQAHWGEISQWLHRHGANAA